jgi:serine/threonine protein kinase
MHEFDYAHRDLNPAVSLSKPYCTPSTLISVQNILVQEQGPEWEVKIADFGMGKFFADDVNKSHTRDVGTPGFKAPEVLKDESGPEDSDGPHKYDVAVDLWSIGVLTYFLLTREKPFKTEKDLRSYVSGYGKFPLKPLEDRGVSQAGCEFVMSLLEAKVKERPSAKTSRNKPWLRGLTTATLDDGTYVPIERKEQRLMCYPGFRTRDSRSFQPGMV